VDELELAFLFHLVLAILNGSIGFYVYFHNRQQLSNRVFAFVAIAIACWAFTIGLSHNPGTSSLYAVRASFAAATLLLLGLVTLFHVFPASGFPVSRTYLALGVAASAFTALSFTSLLVEGITQTDSGLTVKYGRAHPFFALYALLSLAFGFSVLRKKVRSSTGLQRLQLRYLVLGIVVPGVGVMVTNLLIPLAFRVSRFGRYGPVFTLVFLGLTAHALIRHRLMNIRLVIGRSVAYILAVTFSAATFAAVAGLVSLLLTSRQWEVPLWLAVGLFFPAALLFQPLKRFFQSSVDRYLFREPYDYQRVVREATRTIGTMLDLPSLLNYVCEIVARTFQPERVAIYIRGSELDVFHLSAKQLVEIHSGPPLPETISGTSEFAQTLGRLQRHLLRDDLGIATAQRPLLLKEFFALGADCLVPLFEDQKLTGLLALGPKRSGDPYFFEDLDLLATLVGQASIAVKNAGLYREVVLVNEYIENILATMESGVVAISPEGTVTLFNSAAERMSGLPADRIKGLPLRVLPSTLSGPLEASLADGSQRPPFETILSTGTGEAIPVVCSTSLLRDRSGKILGAMAVFSNLSRLKRLEAEKQRAERLASIGALASGVAHEIKNPLVAIKTFAELLPDRFTDEDFRGEFAKVVIAEIERIDDLVARLRGLATAPSVQLRPLDLREPIDDTLSLLRGQLEHMRINVKTTFPPTPILIAGDRAQLKQLFLNILMNALEAMDFGGTLSIAVRSSDRLGSNRATVDITDTGSGISEDVINNIFNPFITTKAKGSGLGLFICRGIADTHRGTIRAKNNPDHRGTTVTIEFPALADAMVPTPLLPQ
jgi:PAS domain S-box-containing protein